MGNDLDDGFFVKATREKVKARILLAGMAGSGKTYTALKIAAGLGGKRIAVIDTEAGSSRRYAEQAGMPEFFARDLDTYEASRYVEAIGKAAAAGVDVLIIDSLSHSWIGEGGMLDTVDKKGGNQQAWGKIRPAEQALWKALLSFPGHLIATARTKTKYGDVTVGDKVKRAKVGVEAYLRDGAEFEFDITCHIDADHVLSVEKTRYDVLSGLAIRNAGEDFGRTILECCDKGAPPFDADGAEAELKACATIDALGAWVKKHGARLKTVQAPVRDRLSAAYLKAKNDIGAAAKAAGEGSSAQGAEVTEKGN